MKSILSTYDLRATAHTLLLLIGGFLLPYAGAAEDWPAWMGPFGQNRSAETGLAQSFDRGDMVNIKWATRLGTVVFGCPTISNGKVFVGTNAFAIRDDTRFSKPRGGVLVCLDEATGKIHWRLVTPERKDGFPEHTHMINQRWGICSSPTVDEDRIYLITNGGDLLCIDIHGMANGNDGPFQDEGQFMAGAGEPPIEITENDADIIWRYDIPRELAVAPHDVGSCSVLVDGDVLYTSTSNGLGKKNPAEALMPEAPGFIALDKRTERLLAIEDEHLSERILHAQWSPPSKGRVNDKDLIFLGGGDGVCYAFEAIPSGDGTSSAQETGRLKTVWKYDCNPHHYKFTDDGERIWYYQGDTRVYKSYKRAKRATGGLNSGDGTFVGPNEILSSPVFYENRVYVATGRDPMHGLGKGVLHCIDATLTGDITESGHVWSYEGIGRTMSSVAIGDGLVYAADLGGRLHCLDAATGELYWVHHAGEESWGNPLLADGKVYFNTTGTFWILAAGKEKKILFDQRGGSEMGAIAANGVVYAFMRGRLYAIAEGAQGRVQVGRVSASQVSNTPESDEEFDASLDEFEDPSILQIPEPASESPNDPPQQTSKLPLIIALAAASALFAVIVFLRWSGRSRKQADD